MITPDILDDSGLLKDIEVISINESQSGTSGCERRIRDVENFFSQPYAKEDGSAKKYRDCGLCS